MNALMGMQMIDKCCIENCLWMDTLMNVYTDSLPDAEKPRTFVKQNQKEKIHDKRKAFTRKNMDTPVTVFNRENNKPAQTAPFSEEKSKII